MAHEGNAMGNLIDYLFDEMDRLNGLDMGDEGRTRLEISRAKAMETTARALIESNNTIISAARLQAEYSGAVRLPKRLGEA